MVFMRVRSAIDMLHLTVFLTFHFIIAICLFFAATVRWDRLLWICFALFFAGWYYFVPGLNWMAGNYYWY